MRVGLIDIKNLVTVRKTFRPGWRLGIALVVLIIVCLLWGAIHKPQGFEGILTDDNLRPGTLILIGVVVLVFGALLFRKGDFARLFFALATLFVGLAMALILIVAMYGVTLLRDGVQLILAVGGLLVVLSLCWDLLVRRVYALCLSLIPLGRWRAYRRQVICSQDLWAGRWKGADAPLDEPGPNGESPPASEAYFRLALGGVACALALASFAFVLISALNVYFFRAMYQLEFAEAWAILRHLRLSPPDSSLAEDASLLAIMLFGLFNLVALGHTWNWWQRRKISINEASLAQQVTSSSVLMFRSFDDDIKFVPGKVMTLRNLFARLYEWSFTFEQLIKERVACVGELRLLGAVEVEVTQKEGLLAGAWKTFQNFMLNSRVPPLGGIRHQADNKEWKEVVQNSMPVAKMIVVTVGMTNTLQDRKSIRWEMDEVKNRGFLRKTVFVMLPLRLPHVGRRSYRNRWEEFTDYLCETAECRELLLAKVDPKVVLAVCFHENDIVVITGATDQLSYESALDVAIVLTIADPAQSGSMIPKYLSIDAGVGFLD